MHNINDPVFENAVFRFDDVARMDDSSGNMPLMLLMNLIGQKDLKMSMMSKRPALFIVLLFLSASVCSAAETPHLFFKQSDLPALRAKVQSGWLREAFAEMKKNAGLYMQIPTDPYPMSGPSNGRATAGRAVNERVNTLALIGMILNQQEYISKAIEICMAAVRQTGVNDFEQYNEHLAIGDALHAYAVAYDWLYAYMTDAQRSELYAEIMEFGEWTYNYSTNDGYYGRYDPVPLSCNHNVVSHGALGLAALATGTHPEWLRRAVFFVEGYLYYARDASGCNYEGIGYYGYGSLNAVTFSVAYSNAGHDDLIAAQPKNRLISEWILRFVQPWGSNVVALNDSPERMGISSGLMRLTAQNRDGVGLWTWLKMYGPNGDGTYGGPVDGYIGDGCTLPYIILFADPDLKPVSPEEAGLPLGKFFARGSGSFRSSWEDDAALATFTCGFDQHRGHNHRDENSFTLSAFGEYFVIDPGYTPNETRCHNSVLVNGTGQGYEKNQYDVCGKTVDTRDFGTAWYMKGDATDAYRNFLNLDHALRKFMFVKAPQPYIVVSDDITGKVPAEFTWLLHTKTDNVITLAPDSDGFYIRGPEADSAVCFVKFLNPSDGLSLSESDLAGETFERKGQTCRYDRFFKEIQAVYTGMNPKFTAVLVAAQSMDDLPEISCTRAGAMLTVTMRFKDGMEDRIEITLDDLNFVRTDAGAN